MKRVASFAAAGLGLAFGASAFAADLGRPGPAPIYTKAPLAVPFNWTGFYAGAQAGYGWSNGDVDVAPTSTTTIIGITGPTVSGMAAAVPGDFPTSAKGFIGGGTLGYNVQTGQFVWGVETDLSWADIKGTNSQTGVGTITGAPFVIAATGTAEEKLDAFGTLRARLGFTPVERLLVYGTGGLAYGHVESNTNISETIVPPVVGLGFSNAIGSASSWRAGWTAGAGVEYAFAPHWSAKAEYLYYDLGSISYNSTLTGTVPMATFGTVGMASSADFKGNIVRGGINYKFW
jgi:outer membrane immunogenic protein